MSTLNNDFKPHITLMGGRIRARRCQALLISSKQEHQKAALNGKRQCRNHGGRSTGPVTEQGRKRCAEAKTINGWETREKRRVRTAKLRELSELERLMMLRGLLA